MEWQEKKTKFSSATTCYGRNGKRSSSTGLAWTTGEKGTKGKSRAQGESGYIRSGLVSGSGVLVLGVLTLDYRIPNLSEKRKEVNPGILDTRYEVRLHHEIGKWISKRRNARVHEDLRGNRFSQSERESGCTYVCGVSEVQNTRRRTEKREVLYV